MTPAERAIADALASVDVGYARDRVFIAQLNAWHDRDMTGPGKAKMIRLLDRYKSMIPDYYQLRSNYMDEQLNNLTP